jgi:hypothetical protein
MKTKTGKLAFILSFIIFTGASVLAQKVNLTGTWAFNEGKSQLGESRFRMPASKITITQDDNTLNMEKLAKGRDGEDVTMKEKYTLDGKVSENTGFMNSVKKSTISWSADNKILTVSSTTVMERDGNTTEIKAVENYKISDDGKTLTIDATTTSPRGERKQTLVYEKTK